MRKAYVEIDYYRDEYLGKFDGADSELERLICRACLKVDSLTFNRIVGLGLERLTEFQRESVRRACCCLADYFWGQERDGGAAVSAYSFQDMKVSLDKREKSRAEAADCDETAWALLSETGLMRGAMA